VSGGVTAGATDAYSRRYPVIEFEAIMTTAA
jgi:hypothetical protein